MKYLFFVKIEFFFFFSRLRNTSVHMMQFLRSSNLQETAKLKTTHQVSQHDHILGNKIP